MDIDRVPEGPKYIPPYNSRNRSSLGDLLLGFLKYYTAEFRYLPRTSQYWFKTRRFMVLFPCSFSWSCSSSPTFPAKLFLLLQSSISPHLPASSSLVSCFWLRGRSRWDLWPYAALTWNTIITVFAVCVIPAVSRSIWKVELSPATQKFTGFFHVIQ